MTMATWHSQPFASPRECALPRAAAPTSAASAGPRTLSTRTRAISTCQSCFHVKSVRSCRGSSSGGGSRSSCRSSSSGSVVSRTGRRRRQNGQRFSARVVRCAASESDSWSADGDGDGGVVGTATTSTAAVRPSIGSETESSAVKLKILALVAGLDRGVAASQADTRRVAEAVSALELSALPMQPFGTTTTTTTSSNSVGGGSSSSLQVLDGTWRLVYSSGFAAGSLGGLRPGPPTGRLPITVGQVLQRIDVGKRELDNIVELKLGVTPWPLPAVEVTATLAHSFETFGAAGIRIIFERTSVKIGGVDSQLPGLSTPQLPDFLQPPRDTRSGEFETTYLDNDFRVSRGDRGELRVFVRAA